MHPIEHGEDGARRIHPEDADEWRAWLAAHHTETTGVWVATWRKASGNVGLTYDALVRQALCFGWIDAVTRKLDDERTLQYCAPRKRGSGWARTNKTRIRELEEAGLIAPAGVAVIAAAKADGSWTLLDDVEDLVVPADLAEAFDDRPGARDAWDGFPPSARKQMLAHVALAKRPATRAARIVAVAEAAARGERL
ncbi:YdeI/OmpD-associated family protein [Demequina sp. SYSU T00192]|uniref:YdeI/OmpD-associated family protein n=1 Tax=Demequina litoralis TaxID=3051660 RepID=A0ABT8GAK0_9MICO|nr:YdeI/OmpD-associated family protein [Demequina sp. SYSU T00192]MDN4476161.1 YdeI/OmpD-associated family protein [Demequina sp. SYSU T00192]